MGNSSTGYDVWYWPEFQAFAKRLGLNVNRDMPTTDIVINLPIDGVATITQTYLSQENKQHKYFQDEVKDANLNETPIGTDSEEKGRV